MKWRYYYISSSVEKEYLVWLITRKSVVQIHPLPLSGGRSSCELALCFTCFTKNRVETEKMYVTVAHRNWRCEFAKAECQQPRPCFVITGKTPVTGHDNANFLSEAKDY